MSGAPNKRRLAATRFGPLRVLLRNSGFNE